MPSYAAWPIATLSIVFLTYFARPILVPLCLAILLAQLLAPVVRKIEKFLPAGLAILIGLGLVAIVLTAVFGVVNDQINALQKSGPDLQQRLSDLLVSAQTYASNHFSIAPVRQIELFKKTLESFIGAGGQIAVTILGVTVAVFSNGILIAILAYLLLYYRKHFQKHIATFIASFSKNGKAAVMDRILEVGQKYIAGLMTVIGIVGVLDTVGFFIVGSSFAVLFGILGGLAVLIPYVGIIIVAPLCAVFTWVATGSATAALSILAVYGVIHFAEGNIITPYLVGHQVNLNPLTSILAVLIGGELWGPAGMLLFIPIIGMVVLAFEMLPATEPLARLLGSVPEEQRLPRWRRSWQAIFNKTS